MTENLYSVFEQHESLKERALAAVQDFPLHFRNKPIAISIRRFYYPYGDKRLDKAERDMIVIPEIAASEAIEALFNVEPYEEGYAFATCCGFPVLSFQGTHFLRWYLREPNFTYREFWNHDRNSFFFTTGLN